MEPLEPAESKEQPQQSKFGEFVTGTKEKLASKTRYITLKIKEKFGRLKPEEFDELLSADFQVFRQDNPPIEGLFSPEEELTRIRNRPTKEERHAALDTFKANLAKQRRAWAECRVLIERSIEFNHDTPKDKLMGLVDQFGGQYGFTEDQKQLAEKMIDGYFEARRRALAIRERFSDDTELVSALSGVHFDRKEKFKVSVGPMTIDIETNGFNSGRIYEGSEKPTTRFRYFAFASQSTGEEPVYYIVFNNNWDMRIRYRESGYSRKDLIRHEYEHQKNTLFEHVFGREIDQETLTEMWNSYESEQDPDIRREKLKNYFRAEREIALEQVRDEYTAMAVEKSAESANADLAIYFLTRHKRCDYLASVRDYEPKKDDPAYQETVKEILIKEYAIILKRASKSFLTLVKEGKYSEQEAIALLTDKPLSDWPKTVRRLLEQQ